LLGGAHTPCGYAARANSDGAKLSFASSLIDLLRSHPVNSTSLSHLSILCQAHHKHTTCSLSSPCPMHRKVGASTPVCLWWTCSALPRGPVCVHVASTLTKVFIAGYVKQVNLFIAYLICITTWLRWLTFFVNAQHPLI
jgi:hypothetical protein